MQVLRSQQESIRPRRVLYLVVLLLLMFQTLYFFPGMSPIYELWNVICFLYLVFVYPVLKWRQHWKLDGFEWYVIALITIVPMMSAVCAHSEFGQPILYGLLTQRSMVAVAAVLFCMHRLRIGYFRLSEVKSSLMLLAWGTAMLWTFMRLALNPANYVNPANYGFVSEGDQPIFALPAQFILIGVLYYALRGLRTGKGRDYLLAFLLFTGAIDKESGRVMILALLVTFLFFAVRWLKLKRLLLLLPAMVVGSGLLVGLLYLAAPQIVQDRLGQFQAAFTVAFTGEASDDPSANGRIPQLLLATDGIQKHPVFGNGYISSQWQGGYQAVMGARFYPEDLGVIGAVYSFGFIGLCLLASQYWLAIRAVKGLPPDNNNPILDATKGFLFYTALGSTLFVNRAATILFFIMLLRYMSNRGFPISKRTALHWHLVYIETSGGPPTAKGAFLKMRVTLKQRVKSSPFLVRLAWPIYREILLLRSRHVSKGTIPVFSDTTHLALSRMKTFEQYLAWSQVHASELVRQKEIELSLSPLRLGSFSMPGTCALCGIKTIFTSNFDYALKQPDGRLLPHFRESLFCVHCGLKNRLRSALHLFVQEFQPPVQGSIYITEQLGAAYRWLKGRYSAVSGSEYIPESGAFGSSPRGIRNEDLGALTWADNSFDFILSLDVLEHVPDVNACFSEIYRCLRPGGRLLFTVPFSVELSKTMVRAVAEANGQITHLMEPEYHGGNVTSPDQGTLCFRYFGWDTMSQLKVVGFAETEAWLFWSRDMGYIGGPQVVLTARKM